MVVNLFPEEVDSVPDMVDFFLNELTLAITVYFLRHIVSFISSSERTSQSVPLPWESFQMSPSPFGELPNQSLSLWERSGEGFHIASHSSYAGGVPSPNLPQGGGFVNGGYHTRVVPLLSAAPSELSGET